MTNRAETFEFEVDNLTDFGDVFFMEGLESRMKSRFLAESKKRMSREPRAIEVGREAESG